MLGDLSQINMRVEMDPSLQVRKIIVIHNQICDRKGQINQMVFYLTSFKKNRKRITNFYVGIRLHKIGSSGVWSVVFDHSDSPISQLNTLSYRYMMVAIFNSNLYLI